MATAKQNRIVTLKTLSPLQAIQAWLCDNFDHGERHYLVTAIQRDRRIELDDDEIAYVIHDALEDGIDATAAFDRLLNAADGVQTRNLQRFPAR
jgi:hypothetical protein